MQHLCKQHLTIKAGVKLSEQSPCGTAGGVRYNLGHNSLKSIVTSGDSVLEGFSVGKAMLSCLQNILYELYAAGCSDERLMKLTFSQYELRNRIFSGNLDARRIRMLLCDWGIEENFHVKNEEYLFEIKTQRNTFAHGNRSFTDVGRCYLARDIGKYNTVVQAYIKELQQIFSIFILNKGYLRKSAY